MCRAELKAAEFVVRRHGTYSSLRGIPSNLPYPGTFGVLPSKKRGRSSNSTPEQRPLFTTTAVSDFCAWLLLAVHRPSSPNASVLIVDGRSSTRYRRTVLLSVILITAGRYLPARVGHAPAGYEPFDPNTRCSPLWIRARGCAWVRQRILRACRRTGSLYWLRRAQECMSLRQCTARGGDL